jgi:glycosyltransferase involved in cell wall biosynthesis
MANPEIRPDLSLVMPCYNEEEVVAITIRRLLSSFERAGYQLEIIAVDNGSQDATGDVIQNLAIKYPGAIVHQRVEVNQGYGHGILSGLPLCTAPWHGMIPADGQVDAEDVVRLYEAAVSAKDVVIAKVRRRFRMDGLQRKLVSISYNLFVRLLWPSLESLDVNGSPKIMPQAVLRALELDSRGWFLDPEIMIKAHYMGVRTIELNVFARMRGAGLSHVRPSTCWEFFRNLVQFRVSRELSGWRRRARSLKLQTKHPRSELVATLAAPLE